MTDAGARKGKYIVLEGIQGVGKTSQLSELARRLQSAGLPVRTLREPDSQSDLVARTIRHITQDPRYDLNTRTEVLLYNAARSQSLEVIRNSIENDVICLVDRNYLTTLAVQFYGRQDVKDYHTLNSIIDFAVNGMEPDLTVVLDAPVLNIKERLAKRYEAQRFDNLDYDFMERMRAGYLWEAKQRNYPVVFANRPFEEVANDIWEIVTRLLQKRTPRQDLKINKPSSVEKVEEKQQANQKASETPAQTNEFVVKSENQWKVTEKGREFLNQAVTDVDGDVYAFTNKLSPITIAAAMARLSRRADDMRITILDEFASHMGKDEKLLQRVITAYGDDSVQQLVGQHIVVEGASNLLTKQLEWGRLASYLEQSTRYIYFDQKDQSEKYRYFTPTDLKATDKKAYEASINKIFDMYSAMVHDLTKYLGANSTVPKKEQDGAWRAAIRAQACDAIRPVLPVATKATVGIYASGQALESMIMRLRASEGLEARQTGQKILEEARKIIPTFLERADKPDRGGANTAYLANTRSDMKLLADALPNKHSSDTDSVKLLGVWPRNEMSLLPHMLFEHSNLSISEIQEEVDSWSVEKKQEAFNKYMGERLNRRHKPGRAVEQAHYTWELICDYGIFRDLQRHRIVDDLEWQKLTPRYGYEVPELVDQANLTEKFEACFDESAKLYSYLQSKGYEYEAQYATLLGHKMRWTVTYNAREAFHLHELRTSPQGHPGYRKLVQEMHDKLCEVHPMLGEAMKFVNQGEDAELTRLAAERATQYKLEKLDKS